MLRRSTTESLANLGRRNQNLLRRQLGFHHQTRTRGVRPDRLANLFELDHLATRMRRNAESLLVLVAPPAPGNGRNPFADLRRDPRRGLRGRGSTGGWRCAASTTNWSPARSSAVSRTCWRNSWRNGLSFSPPDADVEIQGRRIGDSYLIAITDQGIA